MPDRGEVDALTHHEVLHRLDHRGLLVVPALLETGDDLLLGGAVGHLALELVAREPGEDQVGGPAQNPRTERNQPDAGHGEDRHADRLVLLGRHPAHEALRVGLEVVGLLPDHAAAERSPAGTGPGLDALGLLELAGRRRAAVAGRAAVVGRAAVAGRAALVGRACRDHGSRLASTHAASSALSCEATISWYVG